MQDKAFTTTDEYIEAVDPAIRGRLEALRACIKAAAPDAQERISYGMPAFWLNGNLAYFAAFKHHIGFYPTGEGMSAFVEELGSLKTSKGAIQFPHDQDLPLDLVTRMVTHRAEILRRQPPRRPPA